MAKYEPSVHAALNEVHVYVHYLNEKSQKPSELSMTDLILLVEKSKSKEVKELTKDPTEPGLSGTWVFLLPN